MYSLLNDVFAALSTLCTPLLQLSVKIFPCNTWHKGSLGCLSPRDASASHPMSQTLPALTGAIFEALHGLAKSMRTGFHRAQLWG